MLTVAGVWVFMLFVCGVSGAAVLRVLPGGAVGDSGTFAEDALRCLVAGTVVVTVYAEVWSLFGGVSGAAVIVLTVACVAGVVWMRALRQAQGPQADVEGIQWTQWMRRWLSLSKPRASKPRMMTVLPYLILFFLYAYGTSHGIEHYDTGLYHAQAVHWIESYGAVKGLGNLHLRLAYNSAAFPFTALFSFSFLTGKSLHVCAGWCALLLAWKCVPLFSYIGGALRQSADGAGARTFRVSDAARLCALYYLFMIYDEMVSPASDYFVTTLVFYLVIAWCDLTERGEETPYPYAVLSVLAVYLVTLKLSSVMLLLLVIRPLRLWFRKTKKGRAKEILLYLGAGCVVLLPFLLRNVILSGWLVYPFPAIDLFSFDWKIPAGTAAYDAKEIAVYGRGLTSVLDYELPLKAWGGAWFRALSLVDRVALIADAVCFFVLVQVCGYRIGRKVKSAPDYLLLLIVLYAGLFFWFTSAPLIRYGCVYVWLPCVIAMSTWRPYFGRLRARHAGPLTSSASLVARRMVAFLIVLFLAYKSVRLIIDDVRHFDAWDIVRQQDYQTFETEPFTIGDSTFYKPVTGDRAGYTPFPSAPTIPDAVLRGETVAEGFRVKETP